jgi:hypothetical protein
VSFLWWDGCLWDEDRLLLIVTLAGALGALAHGLRSLSWYIGNRRLYASWTAMYFMLPFLGAAISVIFYLIVRGGFFSPTAEVVDTSPFGFAALGALIGMFTEEAVRKLKNVAGTVLTTAEQGKEHVGAAPTITSIAPPTGSTAGQDVVKIAGSNFLAGVQVSFDGLNAAVNEATTTLLTVVTPPHAAGTVVLEVTNADGQKAAASFIYVAPPPPPPPPPGT